MDSDNTTNFSSNLNNPNNLKNLELEKELLEYGFEKEFIDVALKISTKKEEAIDL